MVALLVSVVVLNFLRTATCLENVTSASKYDRVGKENVDRLPLVASILKRQMTTLSSLDRHMAQLVMWWSARRQAELSLVSWASWKPDGWCGGCKAAGR